MSKFDTENNYNNLPFRPGVGMMIVNSSNKIFVGKRIDTKIEGWQMPQGGINIGETPSAAAIREMKEEIGTDSGYILAESKCWYSYNVPVYLIPKLWHGRFKGQKQKWFLIRFTGSDQEININSFKPEFNIWSWVDFDELLEIVIPFKKRLYEIVIIEFQEVLKRENKILLANNT